MFHSCSLVSNCIAAHQCSCSIRVHSSSLVFSRVPFVFTRVLFVLTRVHLCSLVFTRAPTRVEFRSDLNLVLNANRGLVVWYVILHCILWILPCSIPTLSCLLVFCRVRSCFIRVRWCSLAFHSCLLVFTRVHLYSLVFGLVWSFRSDRQKHVIPSAKTWKNALETWRFPCYK